MPTFVDTFERANGPYGNGWAFSFGNGEIASGAATTYFGCAMWNYTLSDPGRHDVSAHVSHGAGGNCGSGPMVKVGGGDSSAFALVLLNTTTPPTAVIRSGNNPDSPVVASAVLPSAVGENNLLRLLWDAGHLSAFVNGTLVLEADSSLYMTNAYIGMTIPAYSAIIYDISATFGIPSTMAVTPNPVWIGGGPVQLTATATGADWTIGVPGSSTLTCDHGEIVGQYTIDAHHINFTYLADLWLGAVMFTESEYGMTATIDVTITPPATAPWGLTLSPTAIAYIERSAVAEANPTIANRQMVVGGGGGALSMLDGLADLRSSVDDSTYSPSGSPGANRTAWLIWRILNGVNAPPRMPLTTPSDTTLKEDTDALKASLSTLVTSNHWTLGDVITQITGSGVPTIKDVLDALAALPGSDLSALTSQLDAMRGDSTTSLATLLSSLAGIRTVDSYSLADVLDAIGDPAQASSPATAVAVVALVAALALAAPTGGASVAAAAVAVGAGPVLDIATIVELVGVLGELAGIAADVAALAARPAGGYTGLPMWPEDGAVDWGDSLTLADGLVVPGPMHGIRVTITSHPNHAGQYTFGSRVSYTHVGAVTFVSGNGDAEHPDSIGLDAQVLTPRTMTVAASCAVRLNGGFSGTIRPWKRSA